MVSTGPRHDRLKVAAIGHRNSLAEPADTAVRARSGVVLLCGRSIPPGEVRQPSRQGSADRPLGCQVPHPRQCHSRVHSREYLKALRRVEVEGPGSIHQFHERDVHETHSRTGPMTRSGLMPELRATGRGAVVFLRPGRCRADLVRRGPGIVRYPLGATSQALRAAHRVGEPLLERSRDRLDELQRRQDRSGRAPGLATAGPRRPAHPRRRTGGGEGSGAVRGAGRRAAPGRGKPGCPSSRPGVRPPRSGENTTYRSAKVLSTLGCSLFVLISASRAAQPETDMTAHPCARLLSSAHVYAKPSILLYLPPGGHHPAENGAGRMNPFNPDRMRQGSNSPRSAGCSPWTGGSRRSCSWMICWSIRDGQGAAAAHSRRSRRSAFARMSILRMMAVMASFGGFPALTSASNFALRSGLKRAATRAGM